MSVDLDWHALDAELTSSVVHFLSSTFSTAPRPNFIGDVSVTSFSFGDTQPSIELMDVRDIDKEFLEVEVEEEALLDNPAVRNPRGRREERSERGRQMMDERSESDGTRSVLGASLGMGRIPAMRSTLRPSSALFSPGLNQTRSIASHSSPPPPPPSQRFQHDKRHSRRPSIDSQEPILPSPSTSSSPSLQIHLRVTYSGNLSIGLATSLLINYPSPKFMTLPLKLSITSLALDGVMLVAFEGDRRRLHVSFVDPTQGQGGLGVASPGARLLSGAVVESEVGQADKHVLKNVGKVEKFVLDVARASLESELIFP
ncbi:BQ2448_7522 [Microbotryum intermedium]|uniref:Mitochondrial distribution and morphology protein 12 n=1 Tax=Microbotryum intermedium TaxID=269621 RepID=A0A238FR68_9BASI|nr:BQ2448_7522 [Microbotryum intermedium]